MRKATARLTDDAHNKPSSIREENCWQIFSSLYQFVELPSVAHFSLADEVSEF